ncbi:Alpha-factor-transporting ATPase [Neolecta irregularis DAH-3]|uniref:Alpha-factor-transporting ATPase n=1 Tax=Neolecta irregularis (strain DAH-3) TaxID=1198029 RepID=A0A1U7LQ07_NEOID|nr:Alpha-factor-transporting ATPase [Neolecta irregularis DAH-3]|eukprot:OLL24745.1 Alpha-factor-transporting ATPase [Neolecta irregularis DAH-3]
MQAGPVHVARTFQEHLSFAPSQEDLVNSSLETLKIKSHKASNSDEIHMARSSKFAHLFAFITRSDIPILLIAIASSVFSGLSSPALTIVLGRIFEAFSKYSVPSLLTRAELSQTINNLVLGLVVIGILSWISGFLFIFSWMMFGTRQVVRARKLLFTALSEKNNTWYDLHQDGAAGQLDEVQLSISEPTGYVVTSITSCLVSVGVGFYNSWSLTLVILSTLPVVVVIAVAAATRIQAPIRDERVHLSKASSILDGAISAIATVKAFNAQKFEFKKFAAAIRLAEISFTRQTYLNSNQQGAIKFVILSMFVQGFWFGIYLVRKGSATPGNVMTTMWSCLTAAQSLQSIAPQMVIIDKGRSAASALLELLRFKETNKSTSDVGIRPIQCFGEISIRDVSFAYPSRPQSYVLRGLSLKIPAYETTYIVGPSGSGKSTIGSLLVRLYEISHGSLTVDNYPIDIIDPNWLRKNVTLVQQDSSLFDDTIFNNIAFARGDPLNVPLQEVENACQMAMLSETLFDLPEGIDTVVTDDLLSGGQRQRVAIARARLRDTSILILDEATSALDYIRRSLVNDAVRAWRRGKTTIIITHDISQIRDDDFAYVMKDGLVVQGGFRRDLIQDPSGPFFNMIHLSEPELEKLNQQAISRRSTIRASWIRRRSSFLPHIPQKVGISKGGHQSTILDFTSSAYNAKLSLGGLTVPESDLKAVISAATAVQKRYVPRRLAEKVECMECVLPQEAEINISFTRLVKDAIIGLPSKFALCVGILASVINGTATPLFSFALSRLLSSLFSQTILDDTSFANHWTLIVLLIAFADGLSFAFKTYFLDRCGQIWVNVIRRTSMEKILMQDQRWFDITDHSASAITRILMSDTESLRSILGRYAGSLLVAVTMIVMGIIWSLIVGWQLTLAGLSVAPVMYLSTRLYAWLVDQSQKKCYEALEKVWDLQYDCIFNHEILKVFVLNPLMRKRHNEAVDNLDKCSSQRALASGFGHGMTEAISYLTKALLFWYGGYLVANGTYTAVRLLTVFTILMFSLSNASQSISLLPQISRTKEAAKHIYTLSNLEVDTEEGQGSAHFPLRGAVLFEKVNFAYPCRPNASVLCDVSFGVNSNESIAIVGGSGSGKSTVISLIQRFYQANTGAIKIDGHEITQLDTSWWRSKIAIVSQSPMLFDLTVAENIAYGDGEFDRAEIVKAARLASIHDFIMTLPEGYDTTLGESGGALSGGQAQRIALARALIRKPRVLILDECTSALDPESSKSVQDAIRRCLNGHTGIIVTHKREMMELADKVVVMENGRVVEVGAFNNLMQRQGKLYNLIQKGEWESKNES